MPTAEEIAEFMRTPEGALELQKILEDLRIDSLTGIDEAAPTGIDTDQLWNSEAAPNIPDATPGLPPEQIGASPNIPGATIGPRSPPPEPIGASPDILGATRGLLPGASGINPAEVNRRRMTQQPGISGINPMEVENRRRMLQQLMLNRGSGLGIMGY
jgi:hypothetical protein